MEKYFCMKNSGRGGFGTSVFAEEKPKDMFTTAALLCHTRYGRSEKG